MCRAVTPKNVVRVITGLRVCAYHFSPSSLLVSKEKGSQRAREVTRYAKRLRNESEGQRKSHNQSLALGLTKQ